MTFRESTTAYEAWLATKLEIVPEDLKEKHELMRQAIFPFFRSTFYRWAQLWPEVCAECNKAPSMLAVGDLHVENFGTWRDAEGRLVWGINDFDEAAPMPYTIDLVRLAASAHLAIDAGHLNIGHREACLSILSGYRESLEAGGLPWILGEKHAWLSELVDLRNPVAFWAKFHAMPDFKGRVPKVARRGLSRMMPDADLPYRVAHRVAGLGSRGRQRFVAIAQHGGATLCREAKALAPSAWSWAMGVKSADSIHYQQLLDRSVRSLDPLVRLKNGWIVRRLAPDCTRIELASVPKEKEKTKLLRAMGWETANIHLGSKNVRAILADLKKRDTHWLHEAAARMVAATNADWKEWGGGARARPARKAAAKKVHHKSRK
ncbi:MAG: DUF2252 family protein [Acidobacteriota bacterium]